MNYTIHLVDGSRKSFSFEPCGLDLAKTLGLQKSAVGLKINGGEAVWDIRSFLKDGDKVEVLCLPSPESLEVIRHTAAHVLAQAVQALWPDVKVTIGPVINDGFYYDFDTDRKFVPEDLKKIEREMKKILKTKYQVVKEIWPTKKALKYFGEVGETLKQEIIKDLGENEVSIYKQGPWLDLCKGPHVQHLGQIGSVKVLNLSGAYWRGDSKNKQLQRIYGTAFHNEKDLTAFLKQREEAKQNDHRMIGKKLDLFWFSSLSPGTPFFTASGSIVYRRLQDFLREKYREQGYEEVITPQIFSGELFTRSGHFQHFSDNMYPVLENPGQWEGTGLKHFFKQSEKIEKNSELKKAGSPNFTGAVYDDHTKFPEGFSPKAHGMVKELSFLKPMNCPGHCLLYKKERRSYRDLPWRVADFGRLHRRESKGAVHGLTRVKSFCQDDAHIFCSPDQLSLEIQKSIKMLEDVYQTLGLTDYSISLSTRPEDRMGSDALWDQAEEILRSALKGLNLPFKEESGEGAFYGPKLDIHVRDFFSRSWQLGTFQCDFNLPEAFQLEYVNEKGERERPILIHRAILGSLERFIGLYLEHRRGRLPLWLCPVPVVILPIGESDRVFAKEIQKKLEKEKIICKMDDRDEKLSYKIRQAQLLQIPYMIVIGKKEAETGLLSLRLREGKSVEVSLDAFKTGLRKSIEEKALDSHFFSSEGFSY